MEFDTDSVIASTRQEIPEPLPLRVPALRPARGHGELGVDEEAHQGVRRQVVATQKGGGGGPASVGCVNKTFQDVKLIDLLFPELKSQSKISRFYSQQDCPNC